MKLRMMSLVLLVFVAAAGTVRAQDSIDTSGNVFLAHCGAVLDQENPLGVDEQESICITYIMGIHNGMSTAIGIYKAMKSPKGAGEGNLRDVGVCLPQEMPAKQLSRIVVKYIRNHPENAHWTTTLLAFNAWLAAFPCRAAK
jgi:hypothetical protein